MNNSAPTMSQFLNKDDLIAHLRADNERLTKEIRDIWVSVKAEDDLAIAEWLDRNRAIANEQSAQQESD